MVLHYFAYMFAVPVFLLGAMFLDGGIRIRNAIILSVIVVGVRYFLLEQLFGLLL